MKTKPRSSGEANRFLFSCCSLAFEILEQNVIDCPIIFTTAYDEYAIRAFRTTGVDYLLKPITAEELNIALTRFHELENKETQDWFHQHLQTLLELQPDTSPPRERFLLKKGSTLYPTLAKDVAYFYRANLVFAVCFDGERYLLDNALNQLQNHLSAEHFFRNPSWFILFLYAHLTKKTAPTPFREWMPCVL